MDYSFGNGLEKQHIRSASLGNEELYGICFLFCIYGHGMYNTEQTENDAVFVVMSLAWR